MKNVRDLVSSIVNGTLKTKVIAGTVAGFVAIGTVAGGIAIYNNSKANKDFSNHKGPAVELTKDELKTALKQQIQALDANINKLPNEDKTDDLLKELADLKGMDADVNYEETNKAYVALRNKYDGIVDKYLKEIAKFNEQITGLDKTKLSEQDLKTLNDLIAKYNETANGKRDFNNYRNDFENVMNAYNAMNKEGDKKDENNSSEQTPNGNGSSEQTPNGSSSSASNGSSSSSNQVASGGSSSSSSSSSSNSGSSSSSSSSSSSGSSSSGSSNSGSSNAGSSAPSQPAPAPAPAPAPQPQPEPQPEPTPAPAPSRPSGWRNDIADQLVARLSVTNTNKYGDEIVTGYESMTTEQFNYYQSLSKQLTDGVISADTLKSQMGSRVFDFFGFDKTIAKGISAGKIEVSGCDFDSIYNAVFNRIGFGGSDYSYCSIYYNGDTDTSTVTWVGAYVDFAD